MFEFELGLFIGGIVGAVGMGIYCVYLTSKHITKTNSGSLESGLVKDKIHLEELIKK